MGGDPLWGGAAARLFALCTAVLAAKLLLLVAYAALVARRRAAALALAADAGEGAAQASPLPQRVADARAADLEGLALFFTLGLPYVQCCGANAWTAQLLFAPFTIASIFHTLCSIGGLARGRAANRAVGWICLLLMAAQVLVSLLRAG